LRWTSTDVLCAQLHEELRTDLTQWIIAIIRPSIYALEYPSFCTSIRVDGHNRSDGLSKSFRWTSADVPCAQLHEEVRTDLTQWIIAIICISIGFKVHAVSVLVRAQCREIGILLPNNQRQHRTLHIQEDVLPYALC